MYILPWIVNVALSMLYSFIEICAQLVAFARSFSSEEDGGFQKQPLIVIICNFVAILFGIYFSIIVLSFHNKLKAQHTGAATALIRA